MHFCKLTWLGLLGGKWVVTDPTVNCEPLIACCFSVGDCGPDPTFGCRGVLGAERAPIDPADLQKFQKNTHFSKKKINFSNLIYQVLIINLLTVYLVLGIDFDDRHKCIKALVSKSMFPNFFIYSPRYFFYILLHT